MSTQPEEMPVWQVCLLTPGDCGQKACNQCSYFRGHPLRRLHAWILERLS